jgi:hypothetical protein
VPDNSVVRRFFCILRAIVAVLSLLLSLASAAIWVRSYFIGDYFFQFTTYTDGNRGHRVIVDAQIGNGGIGVCRSFSSAPPGAFGEIQNEPLNHLKQPPRYPDFRFGRNEPPVLGFKFQRATGSLPDGSVKAFALIMPLWCPAISFLLLSLGLWFYHVRSQRRRKAGHCPKCGYDLRASPEQCPECGEATAKSVEPSGATVAR